MTQADAALSAADAHQLNRSKLRKEQRIILEKARNAKEALEDLDGEEFDTIRNDMNVLEPSVKDVREMQIETFILKVSFHGTSWC